MGHINIYRLANEQQNILALKHHLVLQREKKAALLSTSNQDSNQKPLHPHHSQHKEVHQPTWQVELRTRIPRRAVSTSRQLANIMANPSQKSIWILLRINHGGNLVRCTATGIKTYTSLNERRQVLILRITLTTVLMK